MRNTEIHKIARALIRSGTVHLNEHEDLHLSDVLTIEKLVMYPIKLERCELIGWSLTAPVILEELHNYFWFGQEAGNAGPNDGVENPTKWIANWRVQNS